MNRRRLAFLALAVLLLGVEVLAAHQPPRNLQLVGDHWTAWSPPDSFPEGTEVYIIQRGDTLWDLSNQFYGNPYLWPQLWERNQYILDAHWIYPGDPLVVGVEVTPIEDVEGMREDDISEATKGLQLDSSVSPPVPLGAEDDIYCSGYIGSPDEVFDHEIIGSEYAYSIGSGGMTASGVMYGRSASALLNLSLGDIVYLSGGRESGLLPGSLYTVVRSEGRVRHPRDRSFIGHFYRYQGRIRLLSVQEQSAIAEIVHACHPISVGDLLKPFKPEPVPLARRAGLIGVNDPVAKEQLLDAPSIVLSDAGLVSLGQGHVVYIDRGSVDDLAPGDLFTIYRDTPGRMPPLVIGELAVLSVGEVASLAKILESRHTIHVGDRLDPKPN